MYTRYIIIFIIFSIVAAIGEYIIYLSFHSAGIIKHLYTERILLGFGILLPLMFIVSMIYGEKHFSLLNSWLYTSGVVWLGMLLYVFIAAFIVSIFIFINSVYGLNLPIRLISIILLGCALIVTAYGIYNSNNPKIVRWEIESKTLAPLWKNKKIIFVSDFHLGNVRRENFAKRVIDIINNEKPDIVFNGGDLIDGPVFPYNKGFAPFEELNPPLGSYYVEGNHEGYTQDYPAFKSQFPKTLNDITNKKVIVNGTQIIGLPYHMKDTDVDISNELEKVDFDKNIPSIILMHDPKDIPMIANDGVSLVLSGHTHGGQLFPLTIILDIIDGKYVHGVSYTQNTASLTSSGVGTAMPPIRLGTTPEIIVLTIK